MKSSSNAESKKPRTEAVNSVVRGLNILSSLNQGSMGVVDIAEKLDLNKATVYRLLRTLESSGFVMQDPLNRKYSLGSEIIKLASQPIVSNEKLILCSLQEMISLCKLVSETVVLEIIFGMQRMSLEVVESDEPIRFRTSKGHLVPLYHPARTMSGRSATRLYPV